MHRMHRLAVTLGLALVATTVFAPKASAALLHPSDTSQFPDLSSGYVSGTVHYTAGTGQLMVQNTPYAIAFGPTASASADISATANGLRSQTIVASLNSDGTLNTAGTNQYDLFGTVTLNGKTYSGELLQGTPTAFGSLNTAAAGNGGIAGTAMYDMDIKITGGLLQSLFGTDTYIRLAAERWSTFNGSFSQDFSGGKVSSNIRGFNPPSPAPVPEPTTLVVLIAAGGAGLLVRHRRRIRRDDLETAAA
jgi:hypothetical protein